MMLTRFIHATLKLENNGKILIMDPGTFSRVEIINEKQIDVLVITHLHSDHFDQELVSKLIHKFPDLKVVINSEVTSKLSEFQKYITICEKNEVVTVGGFILEAFDFAHLPIMQGTVFPKEQNTGYLVNNSLFNPADAHGVIRKPVKILMVPHMYPTTDVTQLIAFAIAQKPQIAIPYHDVSIENLEQINLALASALKKVGIDTRILSTGESIPV